jgi:hypothetical protein
MKFPDEPRTGESVKDTIVQLMRWCRATRITGIAGGRVQEGPNGTILIPGKLPVRAIAGGGGGPSGPCRFGEIIVDGEDTAIRGGIIHCGDQNFEVPNQVLNLESAGEWLVWIELNVEANRDDDNEIFLPGIKTGTAPGSTWDKVTWSESASYPANDLPAVGTGTGDIILPIGRLKIEDGAATLIPAGCGNFRISQCAGIFGYSRE